MKKQKYEDGSAALIFGWRDVKALALKNIPKGYVIQSDRIQNNLNSLSNGKDEIWIGIVAKKGGVK